MLRLSSITNRLIVVLLLCFQPWFVWPGFGPGNGQRLTLVACGLIFGIVATSISHRYRSLPKLWLSLVVFLLAVSCWQGQGVWIGPEPTRIFFETAAVSDSIWVILAVTLAVWGVSQLPLRWIRSIGAVLVLLNAGYILYHLIGPGWLTNIKRIGMYSAGLMGLNRYLGAYTVLWSGVLLSWSWWFLLPCVFLVWACGKLTAWIGLAVSVFWLYRSRGWFWAYVSILIVGLGAFLGRGDLIVKLSQRGLTWWHAILALWDKPLVGYGMSPFVAAELQQRYGYMLPSVHSDFLWLGVRFGVPTLILGVWIIWQIVRYKPKTKTLLGIQASLVAGFVMSMGQAVWTEPKLAGLFVVLLAFWLNEKRRNETIKYSFEFSSDSDCFRVGDASLS